MGTSSSSSYRRSIWDQAGFATRTGGEEGNLDGQAAPR